MKKKLKRQQHEPTHFQSENWHRVDHKINSRQINKHAKSNERGETKHFDENEGNRMEFLENLV